MAVITVGRDGETAIVSSRPPFQDYHFCSNSEETFVCLQYFMGMKSVLSLGGKSINPGFLGTQLPIQRIKIAGANSWPLTLRLKDVFNSLTTKTNLY